MTDHRFTESISSYCNICMSMSKRFSGETSERTRDRTISQMISSPYPRRSGEFTDSHLEYGDRWKQCTSIGKFRILLEKAHHYRMRTTPDSTRWLYSSCLRFSQIQGNLKRMDGRRNSSYFIIY